MAGKIERSRDEWMTPDFLSKLERSPLLAKALADPNFAIAAQEMATDPINAAKKYSAHKPEWIQALKEFAGFLGDAFETKANKVDIPKDLPKHEQKLVENVLGNDAVKVDFLI